MVRCYLGTLRTERELKHETVHTSEAVRGWKALQVAQENTKGNGTLDFQVAHSFNSGILVPEKRGGAEPRDSMSDYVSWQDLCKLLRRGDPNLTDMEAPGAGIAFSVQWPWCIVVPWQVQALLDVQDKDKDGPVAC